jgi:16S rRNA processing protein RimM
MKQQIIIGKIVAPHGVRGEFRIMPDTDNPKQFLKMKNICLEDGQSFTVETVRFHKQFVLMTVGEITDMDQANKLRNKHIVISHAELPELPKGRFYVSDIIGFKVTTPEGEEIGTLKDVITPGSTDVFVIDGKNGKEIMVVAIDSNIKEINMEQRLIKAVLPEWVE